MTDIASSLEKISQKISEAAKRSGRSRADITLIAVSKTVTADVAQEAIDAGATNLGESRIQEARRKFDIIGGEKICWHMIGPLQTNKAKYVPGLFNLVHSIDRAELIHELSRRAESAGTVVDCLIQVNVSGETQKSGCTPSDAANLLKIASKARGVKIKGLMTIPPFSDNPEDSRPVYNKLLKLRDDLNNIGIENISLSVISAGMTNDYEVAIEEGATMVRVGTGIFGARK